MTDRLGAQTTCPLHDRKDRQVDVETCLACRRMVNGKCVFTQALSTDNPYLVRHLEAWTLV